MRRSLERLGDTAQSYWGLVGGGVFVVGGGGFVVPAGVLPGELDGMVWDGTCDAGAAFGWVDPVGDVIEPAG